MATTTTRLLLRKPDPDPTTGDLINVVTDINNSMDKLDATAGTTICTSGTRPTGTDRWDGRQIYETDTRRNYMWSAALTTWLPLLVGRGTDGPYLIGQSTDTTGGGINGQGATATTDMLRLRVSGDANPRLQLQADGKLWLGPGSATTNVNLYWGATDQLKTDDTFYAAGGLKVGTNGSGVPVKIDESVLGVASASVTLPTSGSIPATFRNLQLWVACRGSNATNFVSMQLRFNGDTTANYDSQQLVGAAGTPISAETLAQTSMGLGEFAAASAAAGNGGVYVVNIPWYANTIIHKYAATNHSFSYGTATSNLQTKIWAGRWRSTSAITSITLLPSAGNFIIGSSFILYGLP